MSAAARQVRKRIECRTRDLHQSLLVKLSRAMARAHGEPGAGSRAPAGDVQGADRASGEVWTPVPHEPDHVFLHRIFADHRLLQVIERMLDQLAVIKVLTAGTWTNRVAVYTGFDHSENVPCKPSIVPCAFSQERDDTHTNKRVPFLVRPSGGAGTMRRSGGRRQIQVPDAQARLHEPGCGASATAAEGDSIRTSPSAEPHTRELLDAGCLGGERADGVMTGLRLGSLSRARRLLPGLLSWKRGSQEPRAHAGAAAVVIAAVPATPAPRNTQDVLSCAAGCGGGGLRPALAAVEMLLAEAQGMTADAAQQQLLHAVAHVCSSALAGAQFPCPCMLGAVGPCMLVLQTMEYLGNKPFCVWPQMHMLGLHHKGWQHCGRLERLHPVLARRHCRRRMRVWRCCMRSSGSAQPPRGLLAAQAGAMRAADRCEQSCTCYCRRSQCAWPVTGLIGKPQAVQALPSICMMAFIVTVH